MKIEIAVVRNGFMLKLEAQPSKSDPLGARNPHAGEWFARDAIDLLGRIAEAVHYSCDDTVFSE